MTVTGPDVVAKKGIHGTTGTEHSTHCMTAAWSNSTYVYSMSTETPPVNLPTDPCLSATSRKRPAMYVVAVADTYFCQFASQNLGKHTAGMEAGSR